MADAFYVPDGGRFLPTELTRGPWSPDAQHAGPPAALLAREMELAAEGSDLALARFSMDILRPVPLAPLSVQAEIVRSGKRSRYVTAVLADERGEIARAAGWLLAGMAIAEIGLDPTPLPGPDASEELSYDPGWDPSYFRAIEWRLASGSWDAPGPAAVWMRMRAALVAGEQPSPSARVLVTADSGNGISWALDFGSFAFPNTDLTVHLARMPAGEWVCLDARTRIGPGGVGLAESVLWDERGMIGRGAQSLVVTQRRPP